MDSALIWYGLWLLLCVTVFWAAVWWWLPALFRDRPERRSPLRGHRREPEGEPDSVKPRRGTSGSLH
jgi:hypothetical protein